MNSTKTGKLKVILVALVCLVLGGAGAGSTGHRFLSHLVELDRVGAAANDLLNTRPLNPSLCHMKKRAGPGILLSPGDVSPGRLVF